MVKEDLIYCGKEVNDFEKVKGDSISDNGVLKKIKLVKVDPEVPLSQKCLLVHRAENCVQFKDF